MSAGKVFCTDSTHVEPSFPYVVQKQAALRSLYYFDLLKSQTRRILRISLDAAMHVALLGSIVWMTGHPFIFPSLGPTAFALALHPHEHTAWPVIGGHFWGIVSGLTVYTCVASGLAVTGEYAPFSEAGLWLALSGSLSVALTAIAMLATRSVHAPACATTLIISLGLLPTLTEGAIILVSVTLLYGVHTAFFAWFERTRFVA